MNTLNFLDANVWLALLWSRHVHSEKAREWFERSADEQFFFCRFSQLTVLRLLTTEKLMGRDVKSMAQAWDLWDRVQADSRIAFLPEPEGIEPELRARSRLSTRSPKVWADAYLLAFTAVAGVKLVTFDRALLSRGVEVLVL
ncbi:MAG TPA: TA system VapC family ribonuclease toxin [Terriglobales bacterium]|nr:TA system VapC family ribonuclease toxin [Terriglobales bacterium]